MLLHTDDGFRHVRNDTPPGVPTDGGLVVSWDGNSLAVAVGPVERLAPLAAADQDGNRRVGDRRAAGRGGRLAGRRGPASRGGDGADDGSRRHAVDLHRQWLAGRGRRPRPAGCVRARPRRGDLGGRLPRLGHRPPAVQRGGRLPDPRRGCTWTAVGAPGGSAVAALAPCGLGATWSLPELAASGRLRVLRTRDAGATWSTGQPLPASSGRPVWGCRGEEVWAIGGSGTGDRIYASSDGGASWTAEGRAPSGLTALAPTGPADGFAAGRGRSPVLWRVAGAGTSFTRIELPGWVATVGTGAGHD